MIDLPTIDRLNKNLMTAIAPAIQVLGCSSPYDLQTYEKYLGTTGNAISNMYAVQEDTCSMIEDFVGEQVEASEIFGDEILDATKARLRKTLSRIKEKGMYSRGVKLLFQSMTFKEHRATSPWLEAVFGKAIRKASKAGKDIALNDEDWFLATEMVVAMHKPELFEDETCKSYAAIATTYHEELQLYAIMFHFALLGKEVVINDKEINPQENSKEAETLVKKSKELKELKREKKNLERQIEELQEAVKSSKRQITAVESKLSACYDTKQKEIDSLQHDYNERIDDLEEENLALHKQVAWLSNLLFASPEEEVLADKSQEGTKTDTVENEIGYELPDSGVVFLGGHINLVNKLKERHPDWMFIHDDARSIGDKNCAAKVIFTWTNHLSHSLQKKLHSEVGYNVPVVYVAATNIKRLEQEMREGYRRIKEGE